MCGRYVSRDQGDFERNLAFVHVRHWPKFKANYNVSPTQQVPIIRREEGADSATLVRWGLIPFFAHGLPTKYSTINARIETLDTAASWRGPWQRLQRCLVLASGFYEWHVNDDGRKQPFYITVADQEAFGFAGLWDRSIAADDTAIVSCTIITMPANPFMAQIHNARQRMPSILRAADQRTWLEGDASEAKATLLQYPSELMAAWPVSPSVNSPRNNDVRLTEPIKPA